MKRQTRSEARRAAFTQIFMLNQQGECKEQMYDALLEAIPECEDNLGYITTVVNGVDEKREELNSIISAHLKPGWTLARISKASHSILKLAIYEMKYVDDVPPKAAINEAVELAKEYCDEKDAAFVNGLLGAVLKEL
ncbi:MAG: transcription antitermination factor NusB [Clostridiales bacterium]|nr:transcription antitermination factor NusB [Clostridiales bacterium]